MTENCKANSMDSKNLAICWWPTLLPFEFNDMGRFESMRPHLEDTVQAMIDQFPFLFLGKDEVVMVWSNRIPSSFRLRKYTNAMPNKRKGNQNLPKLLPTYYQPLASFLFTTCIVSLSFRHFCTRWLRILTRHSVYSFSRSPFYDFISQSSLPPPFFCFVFE